MTGFGSSSILAVVLAGGQGRRFAGDKTLAELGGRAVIAHVVAALAAQGMAVAINANGDPARYGFLGCPVFPDATGESLGPLAGLLAALRRAQSLDRSAVLAVPGDSPFLPGDLLARLAEGSVPAVAASGGRIHPVIGLWPVALVAELHDMLMVEGLRKVSVFADRVGARRVEWPIGGVDPFFDIDTVDDLSVARNYLKGQDR